MCLCVHTGVWREEQIRETHGVFQEWWQQHWFHGEDIKCFICINFHVLSDSYTDCIVFSSTKRIQERDRHLYLWPICTLTYFKNVYVFIRMNFLIRRTYICFYNSMIKICSWIISSQIHHINTTCVYNIHNALEFQT